MIGPPIITELRQYCQTCGRATLSLICNNSAGHRRSIARCASCEPRCPVCEDDHEIYLYYAGH